MFTHICRNWKHHRLPKQLHADSKVHGANIGSTWVLSAPDGLHVAPMNLAISYSACHELFTWLALCCVLFCCGIGDLSPPYNVQYIPRNLHTVFALLGFVVVIHWLIFPYPSGLLHWHCGNLSIAPVPAKQPWWIWINTSCEFIMNNCITTTKQCTTKPCAYFLGYPVHYWALYY